MQALKSHATQRAGCLLLSALLAFPTFALAQDPPAPPAPPSNSQITPAPEPAPLPPPTSGGWKRVGDQTAQNQNTPTPSSPDPAAQQPPPPPQGDVNGQPNGPNGYPTYGQPAYGGQQPNAAPPPPAYGPQAQGGYNQGPPPQGYPQQPQPNYQAPPPVPASLTMPAGTYLTVRINQMLSSDKNQVGDAFSATLTKPLVVNGVVVAEPGQTVGGHVVEAVKAGHVSGLARLGVQLTDLTLVDGQTLPIKTSLISRTGPSSVGQDAGTIVGTTALGAAVGAAAAWGRGAAIGAGSGLVLGVVGVLVTRGHPSILFPEQSLTFRVEAPVTISTEHAPQAFRYVEPGEYGQQPGFGQRPPGPYGPYTSAPYPAYPPAAAPAPYYYGYPYPYYAYGYPYYPYYWGPGFGLFLGGRYYYGGGYRYYGGPIGRAGFGVGGAHVGGGAVGHAAGGGGQR